MAGEKKVEKFQADPVATGLMSDSCTELPDQDMASQKDGITYDSTSSLPSTGEATLNVKAETNLKSVAEQGASTQPTSYYNYHYPGYNETSSQLEDQRYFSALDGSYSGRQSDNGSLLYYMPGYNTYTGAYMGVDGQHPYFTSSSGYVQQPGSYGLEAMPCYSWDSTYGGEAATGTTALPGRSKSASGTKFSVKSNSFHSKKMIDPPTNNFSTLHLDSKSRPFTASAISSKSILQTQHLKPFNQFGAGFQSPGHVKGFHPVEKLSSLAGRNQGLFAHDASWNYRPNARVYNGNNRFTQREKFSRNGDFEASAELTCGPRVHSGSSTINSSLEEGQMGLTGRKFQYNLEDFQTKYDNAKFYVIKSYSEDDVHKCIKYDVWSSTPNGNKKLDAAFHDAEAKARETGTKCPIFLFFSVNGSGQFVGVAEMVGKVDFDKDMHFWQLDKWNGFFPVKWQIIKDIPNSQLRHIILENNDNRPVTFTRDTQEIGLKQGVEMLNIFKSYSAKTLILDDFNFYENREKVLKAKRGNKTPQSERYNIHNLEAGGNRTESAMIGNSDPVSSVISLTQKLSLGSRPAKSGAAMNSRENAISSCPSSTAF